MFTSTPVYSSNGVLVFGLMQPITLPDPTDEIWILPERFVNRLDLISTNFYGTPSLWHVLASVNQWLDPLVTPPAGTPMRVPLKERLRNEGLLIL
jgi:hypothetical protein